MEWVHGFEHVARCIGKSSTSIPHVHNWLGNNTVFSILVPGYSEDDSSTIMGVIIGLSHSNHRNIMHF